MPTLLAFLPCEKVVAEQGSNSVSIISVLETVTVTIPQGAPPPDHGMAVGMAWSVYSLWQKEPGDTEFLVKATLTSPSGETLLETDPATCRFGPGQHRFQTIGRVQGFPIWTPGDMHLKLLIKLPSDPDFREFADVVMVLKHSTA